jgi:biopolymer transport protein ExbB
MKIALIFLVLLLQVLAQPAWARWSEDWTQRTRITLDTTAQGVPITVATDNVPVLVRLHTGNFAFLDARADGADLRFIAGDDKSPLKFHIERFDGINELAFVWVQVPRVNAGSKADFIWLYYGNEKAVPAGDAKTAYDAPQALVYHFADGEATPQDATANANHALRMTAAPVSAGLAGAAIAFDGKGELVVDVKPSLRASAAGLTVSMWLKPSALDDAVLLRQTDGANRLGLLLRGGNLVVEAGTGAGNTTSSPGSKLTAGVWQHLALVLAPNAGPAVYLNGTEVLSSTAAVPPMAGQWVIGNGYKGELDELQMATTARSAAWLRLAAGSQGPDQKLLAVAAAEAGTAADGGSNYLTVLLGAVTVDGWIVIAILGVMFVVSFWVMISKAFLVRSLARENDRFMSQFAGLMDGIQPGQPAVERQRAEAEVSARYGASPLYRLYAAAVGELHGRFDAHKVAGRELQISASTLSAIKATVDARLVRELQGLNSRLVVLTISIAGGPFLGLLGTVIGVMITFAAIAAAGDVNVNAIAPGIAAALVATVAGLAVAIPCLFGYNFLTSRIGEITADLQAFVDELVTRIAERHAA